MTQRRHHYERAFEDYLRRQRVPYVAVDEARKALLPEDQSLKVESVWNGGGAGGRALHALKSFDFVIYGREMNLLVDVKGRKVTRRMGGRAALRETLGQRGRGAKIASGGEHGLFVPAVPYRTGRLESWVTHDDVESLRHWQALFGDGFEAAFVFVYWCDEQPPDGLFQEIFEYQGKWYALRSVRLDTYVSAMKPRSARWGTVDIPTARFARISEAFAPRQDRLGLAGERTGC